MLLKKEKRLHSAPNNKNPGPIPGRPIITKKRAMKYPISAKVRKLRLYDETILKAVYAMEVWAKKNGYSYSPCRKFIGRRRRRPGQTELPIR